MCLWIDRLSQTQTKATAHDQHVHDVLGRAQETLRQLLTRRIVEERFFVEVIGRAKDKSG